MRLLADENVEPPVVEMLCAAGHEVAWITRDALGASDEEVLAEAEAQGRVLITSDKDYGELVFRLGKVSTGIVLMRFGTNDGCEKADLLAAQLAPVLERACGHFVVVSRRGVRARALLAYSSDEDASD